MGLFSVLTPSVILAQQATPNSQLLQQSERRQVIIDEQLIRPAKSDFQPSVTRQAQHPDDASAPCFPIDTLHLSTLQDSPLFSLFSRYTQQALTTAKIQSQRTDDSHYQLLDAANQPPCLSLASIQNLSTDIQNRFIDKGYITSRVLTPDQSLTGGQLTLSLAAGVLGSIRVDESNNPQTHANRANVDTAFPASQGKPVNLRDLEQGLENLRRLPTVSAQMDIVPGQQAGTSDVEVKWQQRALPIRFNFSVDDSGGKSTGKYLGTIGVAWDNPLHLNDIVSASYTRNVTAGKKQTDPQGQTDHGDTYNYSLNYSVPFGYWSIDAGVSHYFYDQVVAGVNRNYHYTGDSDQGHVNVSRVLYRDDQHKITASAGLWKKTIKNYIDDAEVDVQRRRTGGWKANLSQRSYFKAGTLTSTLGYKRGTRAFGAIEAPEELFDEGTAKSKIWTLDVDWQMPFKLGQQPFSWHSAFHGQWNKTKLTPQDKIAIGGRYSVRGFTGAKSLSAERGCYLRNDLGWRYHDNHQVYVGLDVGHVSGESAKDLPGQTLSGAVLGLKGRHQYHGDWSYDVFIGTPIKEPDGFEADDWVSGFTLGYSY